VLIMHDLFPDVLVMAGLLKPSSMLTKAIRGANALMFRALNAVIIIGRDTEALLLRYRGLTRDRICFIPNWATLVPGVRPIELDNPYRRLHAGRFIVGLSGNLGFTHDPDVVFEAARLLRDHPDVHFLLSGWGIGFERLKEMQSNANLPNVTLVERVPEESLEEFLSAANIWLIPYRKDFAGVSVPSRFYNLLAIGRPVILVSEANAEAALTVSEHGLGWVVEPGKPDELAQTIRLAFLSEDSSRAERAAAVARRFNLEGAMAGYSELVQKLLRES
jgi:colanic acid biosynthesis glycosyl transferase WcaI